MVKFDISKNILFAPGLKHLAEALKANKTMTELNIAQNYATNDGNDNTDMSGVIALADAIPTMRAMTSLNVSNNNLTNYGNNMSGIEALTAAISECK